MPILIFFDDFFRGLMQKIDPEVSSKAAGCLLIAIMSGIAFNCVNANRSEKSRWEK